MRRRLGFDKIWVWGKKLCRELAEGSGGKRASYLYLLGKGEYLILIQNRFVFQLKPQAVTLLLMHLNMTKDFIGARQQLKIKPSSLFTFPQCSPSNQSKSLCRLCHVQEDRASPVPGHDHPRGGSTSHQEEKLPRCLSVQLQYFSWQHISQVSRDPITFKGLLMPSVDRTSSCAVVLRHIANPLWAGPVLAPFWNLRLIWCESRNWTKLCNAERNSHSVPVCQTAVSYLSFSPRQDDFILLIKIDPKFVLNSSFWTHCPYVIYILQNTCNCARAPSTTFLPLKAGFPVLESVKPCLLTFLHFYLSLRFSLANAYKRRPRETFLGC